MDGNATIPWQAVIGNHDTQYAPHIFPTYIGPLEWVWDVGGYRLIGINSMAINYTALDQALTNEKLCIVFGHFPLNDYNIENQSKLRQRFQVYYVLLYVEGHEHVDSWEVDPYSGTRLLVGSWACGNRYRFDYSVRKQRRSYFLLALLDNLLHN